MTQHVDFAHVRKNASFEAIMRAYEIELIKDGPKPGQFKALCPFHADTKPSLKVNTDRNIFNCFACDAGGNILEFVRDMDGLADDAIRPAALKAAELSGIEPSNGKGSTKSKAARPSKMADHQRSSPPPTASETLADEEPDGVPYNRVLTFELKTERDDALKVWLETRGLSHDVIQTFNLGRASNRSKTIGNRLAIPIHNSSGELVAYCGRYVGDDVPDDAPKYRLPGNFRKDLEVFNLHRAATKIDSFKTVLIFESYFSVMRHHQHAPCVSFMGRSISTAQIALMVEHLKSNGVQRAIVIADGDQPGVDGARTIAGALAPFFWAKVLDLADGEKPHRLEWDDLSARLKHVW